MAVPVTYLGATSYQETVLNKSAVTSDVELDVRLNLDFSAGGLGLTSADQVVVTDVAGTALKSVKENFVSGTQTVNTGTKVTVSATVDTNVYPQYGASLSYSSDTTLWSDIGIPSGTYANRYSLDEESGAYVGAHGDNLTVSGGTQGTTGLVGKAWTGNATTGYLYGGTAATLNRERNQPVSIISVMKNTSTTDLRFLVFKMLNGSSYRGTRFYIEDPANALCYSIINDSRTDNQVRIQQSTATFTDTTTWHVAAVTDPGDSDADTCLLYDQGTSVAFTKMYDALTGTIVNAANFMIGGRGIVGSSVAAYSYFVADETRVYNVVKSPEYIKSWDSFVRLNSTYVTYGDVTNFDFGGPPVASFTVDEVTDQPKRRAYTDTSTNTPTSWSWTVNGTEVSTSQNPTLYFAYPGTYTVALTATNGSGSDSYSEDVTIAVSSVELTCKIINLSESP